MCQLCDDGQPRDHGAASHASRRDFLKVSTATAASAAAMSLLTPSVAAADPGPPKDHGKPGRRYVIRGGYVMSLDPAVGEFAPGDVLVEGSKILAVGPNLAEVGPGHRRAAAAPGHRHHHHQLRPRCGASSPTGFINDGSGTPSEPDVLRVHPEVRRYRPGGRTSASQVGAARRRRHRARHLADPPLAAP
jgi:hypothetical protein